MPAGTGLRRTRLHFRVSRPWFSIECSWLTIAVLVLVVMIFGDCLSAQIVADVSCPAGCGLGVMLLLRGSGVAGTRMGDTGHDFWSLADGD